MPTTLTPEQTNALVGLMWSDEYGHLSQPELEAEAIRRFPTPYVPKYDVEKIRKAYTKVQAAMKEAKDAGDTERLAELKPDYMAIKDLLIKAKEEQVEVEKVQKDTLKKEVESLREQIKTARKTIGDLKFEVARLTDENRTLRAPPPVEEYRKAQIMPMPSTIPFSEEDMLAEIDAITGGQKA